MSVCCIVLCVLMRGTSRRNVGTIQQKYIFTNILFRDAMPNMLYFLQAHSAQNVLIACIFLTQYYIGATFCFYVYRYAEKQSHITGIVVLLNKTPHDIRNTIYSTESDLR